MIPRLALLLLLTLCAAPAFAQPTGADPFRGLNLLLTSQRLTQIRQALAAGHPLMTQARDQVIAGAQPYLTRDPEPIPGALAIPGFYTSRRDEQRRLTRRIREDGYGAHALALAYALTRDARYADRSETYLFAWVDAGTYPVDGDPQALFERKGDTPIVTSYSLPNFCYAYDILRGLGRIDAVEHTHFSTWLRPFVDYHRDEPWFRNNHHDWRNLFLACAGHVLEDRAVFDLALQGHRDGMRDKIAKDGSLWRELVRGKKAATYTLMALEGIAQLVHVAETHGVTDLRDLRGEQRVRRKRGKRWVWRSEPAGNLRDAVDRLRGFVEDPASWRRYLLLTRCWDLNGPAQRGDWGYFFELPYAWWGDATLPPLLDEAPYGLRPPRCYTQCFATLYFRPLP